MENIGTHKSIVVILLLKRKSIILIFLACSLPLYSRIFSFFSLIFQNLVLGSILSNSCHENLQGIWKDPEDLSASD